MHCIAYGYNRTTREMDGYCIVALCSLLCLLYFANQFSVMLCLAGSVGRVDDYNGILHVGREDVSIVEFIIHFEDVDESF